MLKMETDVHSYSTNNENQNKCFQSFTLNMFFCSRKSLQWILFLAGVELVSWFWDICSYFGILQQISLKSRPFWYYTYENNLSEILSKICPKKRLRGLARLADGFAWWRRPRAACIYLEIIKMELHALTAHMIFFIQYCHTTVIIACERTKKTHN